jgi:hypothetical protein
MPFSSYVYSNRFRFNTKYVLPIIASMVTYAVIGQFYTVSLSEKDLVSSSGRVSVIKKDTFLQNKGRDTTRRVSIKLFNSKNDFFLFDNSGEIYESIKQNVNTGDEVSILHRTQWQSIIGLGNEFQIFKLEKGGDILYHFGEAKQTFGTTNVFEILVVVGLWLLYFYFRHILKLLKQQPT